MSLPVAATARGRLNIGVGARGTQPELPSANKFCIGEVEVRGHRVSRYAPAWRLLETGHAGSMGA